jgi:protein TonB
METKKNPAHDVHRSRTAFFVLGLLISIGSVITAFEWKTMRRMPAPRPDTTDDLVYVLPDIIRSESPEPELPKPQLAKTKTHVALFEVREGPEAFDPEIAFTPDETWSSSSENPFVEPEDTATYFGGTAEFAPQPLGGYAAFYNMIGKELKYPRAAIRNHIGGKVFVEFVINADGRVQNTRIVKGIGAGCDEEAMRVIGLSHWEPGRQRGKPVKVRMVLPIQFVIQ